MSRPVRRLFAIASFAVFFQAAGLSPVASGAPIPRTVTRSVAVSLAPLVRGAAPAITVSHRGVLRAAETARTSPETLCSPIWFTAAALTWTQHRGGLVHASIANGAGRQAFGPPETVASEPAEAPDPGTPESHPSWRSTELLWTGGGRCLRFSLTLPPGADVRALHAVFLNTSGTAAGPGTGPSRSSPIAAAAGFIGRVLAPTAAQAKTARPDIVTREEWGADPRYFNTGTSGCAAPYYASQVKMAFVHHTAGSNDYTRDQSDDIVRAIYYFHTQNRGYCDIAYNFLIDRFGTIFEGRAGGMGQPVIPGSQMGFNTSTFSVATMGTWQDVSPPAATVSSLERLLSWRLDVAHLPPNGYATMVSAGGSTTKYPAGTVVHLHLISGHRDTGITECPGDRLYSQLPEVRKVVYRLGGPKLFRPAESAGHVTPGGRPVTFTARSNQSVTWRVTIVGSDGEIQTTMFATGSELDLPWGGLDGAGQPVPPGAYTALIGGQGATGAAIRPAGLPIAVNAATSSSPATSTG
jgi:hypothetical protein